MIKDLGKLITIAAMSASTTVLPASAEANHIACKPEATRITRNLRVIENQQKTQNPSGRNIPVYAGAYDAPHLTRSDVECIMGEVEMLNPGYRSLIKQIDGGWTYMIMPLDVYEEIQKKSK